MAQTVIGIFDNASEAQNAVQQLINLGFTRDNIDISSQSNLNSADYTSRDRYDNDGSVSDSIGDFFSNLFGGKDDDDVRNYSDVARRGTVVTVHAISSEQAERAADILDEYGAVDVNERASQYRSAGTGYTGTAATTGSVTTDYNNYDTARTDTTDIRDRDIDNDTTGKLNVIEEELHVGKRVVETGGARIRSRIIERPVEERLRLREEHVRVERNPVNRAATEADLNNFREGTIEVTEHAEVPVVNKEARVVEEISLSKEVEEHDEVIRDSVRKTEVDIDDLDKGERYRDLDADRTRDIDSDDEYRRRSSDSL
jgi:stress response protein YsnF